MAAKPWMNYQFMYDQYKTKRRTIAQIAEECKTMGYPVTPMTIYNWLVKLKIKTDGRTLGSRSAKGGGAKRGFYG